ncbi:hypothetical protein B0H14DRAFT_2602445 [Mycena olivaceomarginata]|nr:hypothetical protein B0H14DRAFT_2602445 [Mycena olivaceomarginata]
MHVLRKLAFGNLRPTIANNSEEAEFFQTISHTRGGPNYHAHTEKALKMANFAGYSTSEGINKKITVQLRGRIAGGKVAKKKKDNGNRTTAGNEVGTKKGTAGNERTPERQATSTRAATIGGAWDGYRGSRQGRRRQRLSMGRQQRVHRGGDQERRRRVTNTWAVAIEHTGERPSSTYGAGIVGTAGRVTTSAWAADSQRTDGAWGRDEACGRRVTSTGSGRWLSSVYGVAWARAGRVTSAQAADSERGGGG